MADIIPEEKMFTKEQLEAMANLPNEVDLGAIETERKIRQSEGEIERGLLHAALEKEQKKLRTKVKQLQEEKSAFESRKTSSGCMSEWEIALAKASGVFEVIDDGLGWVPTMWLQKVRVIDRISPKAVEAEKSGGGTDVTEHEKLKSLNEGLSMCVRDMADKLLKAGKEIGRLQAKLDELEDA